MRLISRRRIYVACYAFIYIQRPGRRGEGVRGGGREAPIFYFLNFVRISRGGARRGRGRARKKGSCERKAVAALAFSAGRDAAWRGEEEGGGSRGGREK